MYLCAVRYLQLQAKKNSYFILFFFIGLFLNLNFSYLDVCERVSARENRTVASTPIKINPVVTIAGAGNGGKKLVRPRYYSTELGIREKLFVGVLTSQEQIDCRAVAVNRTVSHLSDKVKFFMSASHRYKTGHGLGNIVGFTDARESLRPFHIVKYIGDGFGQNYDYFFLMKDSSYLDAHLLKYIANKISVSQDVYLGTRVTDGSYCSLDAGILLSNSVVLAMRANIEWCVRNAFSDNHSDNLGRCVAHSIGLECQDQIQGQTLTSYRLKHYSISKNLGRLSENPTFNSAVVVHPVSSSEDMYTLHAYRCRMSASSTQTETEKLRELIKDLKPDLPPEYSSVPWPVGHRPGNAPGTRFDVTKHSYFNLTHKFFRSDYSNVDRLSESERLDIENVLGVVTAKAHYESNNVLKYRRLVNGYSVFDLSRGLDYTLDVGFKDQSSGKEIIKRFQVCKPLGKVEMLPMPYVTENKRVTVLVPISEKNIGQVRQFTDMYSRNVMERNQKTFIMFALLYQFNSPSKGDSDVFLPIKNLAMELTTKHQQQDNNKVAWVSIRLPDKAPQTDEVLDFATVDLALKKIGTESLVLLLDLHVEISVDFLNRVRMNTIMGAQIFNIIPFRQYHPVLSGQSRIQVHKSIGQFDSTHHGYISFYGRDYVNARLAAEEMIPIVRTDRDIQDLLSRDFAEDWTVFKLFVRFGRGVHSMRATDPGLKIRYHDTKRKTMIGSKVQLAYLILTYGRTII